jgi:C-terminal processing protease CtpA/Prc
MFRVVLLLLSVLVLAACGGSGGGGGGLGAPGGGSNNDWQMGVFEDYNTFFARCDAPRSGTNPATGNPYPDIAGSILDENNFLRSFSDDTYLWYDEIVDQDPGTFTDPLVYFEELKTFETAASGQPGACESRDPAQEFQCKDRFHFTYDSEEWFQLSQSGVSAGYGVRWALVRSAPPRDIRIVFTQPDSPATNLAVPLARGARILEIDGVDVENGADVDTLNAGLYPESGETHTFVVQDLGSTSTRAVTMTAENVTQAPVQDTRVISTPTGEIGYINFLTHIGTAEQALIDAVDQLNAHNGGAGIDDLVVDLRYNGGGFLAIASELAYMIAGQAATAGQTFEELQFNDKYPDTNPITGETLAPTPFYSRAIGGQFFNGNAGESLPTLDLPRVFVLTGGNTCSASEAVINGLRGIGIEVIQVGSTTCGKPYGFYGIDNCGTTYFTINFKGINAAGFGEYSSGFSPANSTGLGEDLPGCSVADDLTKLLGDPTENRLAAALAYRDGDACPTASGATVASFEETGIVTEERDIFVPMPPWQTNRLMTPQ